MGNFSPIYVSYICQMGKARRTISGVSGLPRRRAQGLRQSQPGITEGKRA